MKGGEMVQRGTRGGHAQQAVARFAALEGHRRGSHVARGRRAAEPPSRRVAEPPRHQTAAPPNRQTAAPPNRRAAAPPSRRAAEPSLRRARASRKVAALAIPRQHAALGCATANCRSQGCRPAQRRVGEAPYQALQRNAGVQATSGHRGIPMFGRLPENFPFRRNFQVLNYTSKRCLTHGGRSYEARSDKEGILRGALPLSPAEEA